MRTQKEKKWGDLQNGKGRNKVLRERAVRDDRKEKERRRMPCLRDPSFLLGSELWAQGGK